ncbi:hypothetical protein OF83DRAFT_1174175 [Amylostereum chailletii]|nr:hypothetical protein OF83DRAFT_1174175 [Amylostereum chailletii]
MDGQMTIHHDVDRSLSPSLADGLNVDDRASSWIKVVPSRSHHGFHRSPDKPSPHQQGVSGPLRHILDPFDEYGTSSRDKNSSPSSSITIPSVSIPVFPEDVPSVPLLVIDYELIKAGDEAEIDRLWEASTELGFWYLKNHGVQGEVASMFELGGETMHLPLSEKMRFEQDDALSYPTPVHRTYPSTVTNKMEDVVAPFVRKSVAVTDTLLDVLNKRLGLPDGTLANLHKMDEPSGSEARCIKTPRDQRMSPDKATLGAHTDFGSLVSRLLFRHCCPQSFLHHNRLGSLQVLLPGTEDWKYVKPLPGHAICNLGDAMTIFSGGILRSNLHRVVPPPNAQSAFERWSLVFFTRPNTAEILAPLAGESALIAEAVNGAPEGKFDTGGSSAGEWFARRIKNQRIANRTGPETWLASRGMEHKVEAV